MKEYSIAIIGGIFAILAAVIPIIFSKQKKEKRNSEISNKFNLDRSNGNTFQVVNGDIDSNKGDYVNDLRIKAEHTLFELASRLIKLTTDDFYPLRSDYLNEVCNKYKEMDEFFDSKEYLFNNKIADTIKSIKEITSVRLKVPD